MLSLMEVTVAVSDETVAEFYADVSGLGEEIIKSEKDVKGLDEKELAYRIAMVFFFGRSYKSYQALYKLWSSGFEEDAYVVLRGIYESFLQARYVAREPHKRAMQLTEYDFVERYKFYRRTGGVHREGSAVRAAFERARRVVSAI